MLQASLLQYDANGRVRLSPIGGVANFNSGTPVDDNGLLVVTTTEPTKKGWMDGLTYDAVTGALYVTESGTVTHTVSGNPMVGDALRLDASGAPKYWIQGVPLSNTGICTAGPVGTGVDWYFNGSVPSDLTFARASTATYWDRYGVMQSAAIDEPRYDFDPKTGDYRGLLIEESRINKCPWSQSYADHPLQWVPDHITFTKGQADVAGGTNAEKMTATVGTGLHRTYGSVSFEAGVEMVCSVYAKMGTQRYLQILTWDGTTERKVNFDLQTGAVGGLENATGETQDVGNGWYRCIMYGTGVSAGGGDFVIGMVPAIYSGPNTGFDATGDEYFIMYGVQVERNTFATSYIPTAAAAVTRSADTLAPTTLDWFDTTKGTALIEFIDATYKRSAQDLFLFGSSLVDSLGMYRPISGDNTILWSRAGGVNQAILPSDVSVASPIKAVIAYANADYATTYNGTTIQTQASGTVPTITSDLRLGATGAYNVSGSGAGRWLRRWSYWPKRLTNAQLVALTA